MQDLTLTPNLYNCTAYSKYFFLSYIHSISKFVPEVEYKVNTNYIIPSSELQGIQEPITKI